MTREELLNKYVDLLGIEVDCIARFGKLTLPVYVLPITIECESEESFDFIEHVILSTAQLISIEKQSGISEYSINSMEDLYLEISKAIGLPEKAIKAICDMKITKLGLIDDKTFKVSQTGMESLLTGTTIQVSKIPMDIYIDCFTQTILENNMKFQEYNEKYDRLIHRMSIDESVLEDITSNLQKYSQSNMLLKSIVKQKGDFKSIQYFPSNKRMQLIVDYIQLKNSIFPLLLATQNNFENDDPNYILLVGDDDTMYGNMIEYPYKNECHDYDALCSEFEHYLHYYKLTSELIGTYFAPLTFNLDYEWKKEGYLLELLLDKHLLTKEEEYVSKYLNKLNEYKDYINTGKLILEDRLANYGIRIKLDSDSIVFWQAYQLILDFNIKNLKEFDAQYDELILKIKSKNVPVDSEVIKQYLLRKFGINN